MSKQDRARETSKAHAAFLVYCEMGYGRSLEKLAGKLGVNSGQIERWSTSHQWQERVKQYDTEQLKRRREAEEQNRQEDWEAVRKMLLEHINAGVEASPASQIQAAKLLLEHYMVAEDLAQMKKQQELILAKLQEMGIEL